MKNEDELVSIISYSGFKILNMKDIKETIADVAQMLTVLSALAKHNPQFDMRYSQEELAEKANELFAHLRELYKKS